MTARIQRDFQFVSGVYVEDEFVMNVYNVDIQFTVESESIFEQNVALERIKYFFLECIENCIFINESDEETIERFASADLKLCLLPEDPYDQIVGIMLLVKLNSIAEGRLQVSDIRIESKMCDGVSYLHSMEEHVGPFMIKGWWTDSSPKFSSKIPKSKGKKVVKLNKTPSTWDDLNLGWKPKKQEPITSEIVFASFQSKTDK